MNNLLDTVQWLIDFANLGCYSGELNPQRQDKIFAALSGVAITGSRARQEVTLWQEWEGLIWGWGNLRQGLGGWTMSIYHAYDPAVGTVWYGDGRSHNVKYAFGDIITTVAGTSTVGYSGDGGLATQARLYAPQGVAVGGDGSLYIADTLNNRIRLVGADGIITTMAGTSTGGYSGDGGPATQARLYVPQGIAVGADGSLYIADGNRIRKVTSSSAQFEKWGSEIAIPSEDGSEVYILNPANKAKALLQE